MAIQLFTIRWSIRREHDKMWGDTGDLYGNTVAGIWRTPHFVMLPCCGATSSGPPLAKSTISVSASAKMASCTAVFDIMGGSLERWRKTPTMAPSRTNGQRRPLTRLCSLRSAPRAGVDSTHTVLDHAGAQLLD